MCHSLETCEEGQNPTWRAHKSSANVDKGLCPREPAGWDEYRRDRERATRMFLSANNGNQPNSPGQLGH